MKRKVGIVVDSTARLNQNLVDTQKIDVATLKVMIGESEYIDGTFDPHLVEDALKKHVKVKTSQPSPDMFIKAYENQLSMFDEVICLTLSKSLSGTFNSATLAQTILENKNVHVVDSETTITGLSYLTEKLVEYLEEGHNAKEGLLYLEELKAQGSLVFTVDNLSTLHDNGRLSKLQATIGNFLRIKPILRFKQGVLEVEQKVRGFQKAFNYLVNEVKGLMLMGQKAVVRIAYVDRSVEAKELEHALFQLGDNVDVKVVGVVSPVISAHVGLGGLGIYLGYE